MRWRDGADRSSPEWAKPLAPLPEWLAAVDELLDSINHGNERENEFRYGGFPYLPPLRSWVSKWRERFALTHAQVVEVLGYEGPEDIARYEWGNSVRPKRIRERQRALAEERWSEPIADRASWLRAWRKRLGISQCKAASILGYRYRCAVSRVECNEFNPSWEKILIAIHAERALRSE